jgi:transcription initiation factor TFIIIB Brf1 subunit/transcription initiation factor TFIIB
LTSTAFEADLDDDLAEEADVSYPGSCEECGSPITEEDGERVCPHCGLVQKSSMMVQQPFYRKPTSNIAKERNLGTSHRQVFDALLQRHLIRSLDGKKDAKTFYGLRHLYTGSKPLRERILDEALERLSDFIEFGGRANDHQFANLCGKALRHIVYKRLPKRRAIEIELAQHFINENRPSSDEIDGMIVEAFKRVDPIFFERTKTKILRKNGLGGKSSCQINSQLPLTRSS